MVQNRLDLVCALIEYNADFSSFFCRKNRNISLSKQYLSVEIMNMWSMGLVFSETRLHGFMLPFHLWVWVVRNLRKWCRHLGQRNNSSHPWSRNHPNRNKSYCFIWADTLYQWLEWLTCRVVWGWCRQVRCFRPFERSGRLSRGDWAVGSLHEALGASEWMAVQPPSPCTPSEWHKLVADERRHPMALVHSFTDPPKAPRQSFTLTLYWTMMPRFSFCTGSVSLWSNQIGFRVSVMFGVNAQTSLCPAWF